MQLLDKFLRLFAIVCN